MKQPKPGGPAASSLLLLLIWRFMSFGELVCGQMVAFHIANNCPFPIWPATASNVGHPLIADGGFLLVPNQIKRIEAPPGWSGRFWARTGCNFTSSSSSKPACLTGDCQSLLACNGAIGLPPATLIEVSLQPDRSQPSFYDVSLVDGYNLPVSVSAWPSDPRCSIRGCTESINSVCPHELQVLDKRGVVIACKSACLAFDLDVFCCRNSYGSPETCKASVYSKMFKEACPCYVGYAFDTPTPLVKCWSKEYLITFCPSKWHALELM